MYTGKGIFNSLTGNSQYANGQQCEKTHVDTLLLDSKVRMF